MDKLGTSSSSDRYDFSNPFFTATIVTGDGMRFPLWQTTQSNPFTLKSDSTGKEIQGTKALAFLSELTVEVQLAYLSKITATLTPPYRDAINLLDSNLMNWGTARLEVQFGYISNTSTNTILSPIFTGVLLKPDVTLGQEPTITLNAQGVSGLFATRQSGTRVFNSRTRIDIIRTIATGEVLNPRNETPQAQRLNSVLLGHTLTVEPKEVEGSPFGFVTGIDPVRANNFTFIIPEAGGTTNPKDTREVTVDTSQVRPLTEEYNRLFGEVVTYAQGGKTDWRAIWELCEQANCYYIWEGSGLKIIPKPDAFSGAAAKRTLRLYEYPQGTIGPSNGVFPIFSASSPTMAVYLPGAAKGLHAANINPDTRQAESVTVNDKNTPLERTAEGGASLAAAATGAGSVDDITGDGQGVYSGELDDPQLKQNMESEFRKAATGMGINLTVETFADPLLFPGDVINVRGLGERLNQPYSITNCRWVFGLGGSNMTLQCVTNVARVNNQIAALGTVTEPPDEPDPPTSVSVEPTEGGV